MRLGVLGALLQLIDKGSDHQIATNAQEAARCDATSEQAAARASLDRPSGNFVFELGHAHVSAVGFSVRRPDRERATARLEPGMFGLVPIPAVRQALERAMETRRHRAGQINEAFARSPSS